MDPLGKVLLSYPRVGFMLKIMKQLFTVLLFLVTSGAAYAQQNDIRFDINELFKLRLDSIERRVITYEDRAGISFYMHYSVTNLSSDTLTYITNFCFYYDQCSLSVDNAVFDVNTVNLGCMLNYQERHSISPGGTYSHVEWINNTDSITSLKLGQWLTTLSIPLVVKEEGYLVEGRATGEKKYRLFWKGEATVVETNEDCRKRKKKKKRRQNH